jgi:polysaccharide biosynthesis protein PslH
MKVLWFSHMVPYPPIGGARQRSFNLLQRVAAAHETHLIAFNLESSPPATLASHQQELSRYCASVEFWEPPVAWRSMAWWLRLPFNFLSAHPYSCESLYSTTLAARLSTLLKSGDLDDIHMDSIDLGLYAPLIMNVPRRARFILNHHNCESAMAERRAQQSNPLARVFLIQQASKLRSLESKVAAMADINITVSGHDESLLRAHVPELRATVVDNGTDTDYFRPQPELLQPDTVVFAGSLDWYPNVHGLRRFRAETWPRLRDGRPQLKLLLAGRNPASSVRHWAQTDPSVKLVADPSDIRPCIASGAVFVCPIYDGGGTRLKLLDAMAMGKAIVSTTIGAEGLEVTDGEHLLMADSAEAIAAQIIRLLDNNALRKHLETQAREFVVQRYSWNAIAPRLLRLLVGTSLPQR